MSSTNQNLCPPIALELCLAKTRLAARGLEPGRNVEEHCRIAMSIAKEFLRRLAEAWPEMHGVFPSNSFLGAALHDIGKISPTFQKKIYDALNISRAELANVDPDIESAWNGHASVSYSALKAAGAKRHLLESVGSHHGRPPKPMKEGCANFGGEPWAKLRSEAIQKIRNNLDFPLPQSRVVAKAMTGLTILSDWIASGPTFDNPDEPWQPLVPLALDAAGFTWHEVIPNLSFAQVFGFDPNDIQKAFIDSISGPGLYILEAPMGHGKTEAALFAAYRLLAERKACGIYFGLPTQLTSNRMQARVNQFLARIFPEQVKSILAHGEAWLQRFLNCEMDDTPAAEWFEHGKRAILAPFAVGTADQALLAITRAKWSPLRLLGLAGKVIILDEAHSYDSYTGELMDILVEALMALGSTVIILSATLTEARQASLMKRVASTISPMPVAYPVTSAICPGLEPVHVPLKSPANVNVRIRLVQDEQECIEEALDRAEQGQQVLWIENTVDRAQSVYQMLAAKAANLGIKTGLIHSRFTSGDRSKNEKYWTGLLGKPGTMESEKRGERGRILVGTQVLEQSLDIDADFLISRFAPTDLLLQRIGRLWRHDRADRSANSVREAWFMAPELEKAHADPQKAFEESGTSWVYDPYTLTRSLEVWTGISNVRLPSDIRPLLEASHAEREAEPTAAMTSALKDLASRIAGKIGMAKEIAGSLGAEVKDDESSISTRLIEMESLKVLLLKNFDMEARICTLMDGTKLALPQNMSGTQRTGIAASLAAHTVKVPVNRAPERLDGAFARLFAPYFFEARNNRLRIILIGPDETASSLHGVPMEGIKYNSKTGYCHAKN